MSLAIEKIISKEQFGRFMNLQQSGLINMSNISVASDCLEMPADTYKLILKNYSYLRNIYGKDNRN